MLGRVAALSEGTDGAFSGSDFRFVEVARRELKDKERAIS